MVFAGVYPIETDEFENLRTSLEKLQLNDASLTFQPESSAALGFGFRCGFLGLLHMEIVQERLDREYGMSVITTVPNVSYHVFTKKGKQIEYIIHRVCQISRILTISGAYHQGFGDHYDRLYWSYHDALSGQAWHTQCVGLSLVIELGDL